MYFLNISSQTRPLSAIALIFALVLAGCDSGADAGEGAQRVDGRVTNDQGFTSNQRAQSGAAVIAAANVEGATVTAVSVDAEGQTDDLEGSATTNAEGQYSLDLGESANLMILTAAKSDFESQVMVYARGGSSVDAMPMTIETDAEADVYIEAKQEEGDVTMADVAGYVGTRTGVAIDNGTTNAAEVASVVVQAVRAEYQAAEDDVDREDVKEEKQFAFFTLQGNLSASSDSETDAAADIHAFEEALANVYLETGTSAEAQAKIRQSGGATAVIKASSDIDGEANFFLRQRAQILASAATATAIQSRMEAEGASQASIEAIADARADLLTALRASSKTQVMRSAKVNFSNQVKAALATELGVDVSALTGAVVAITTLEANLNSVLGLGLSVTADAIAEAYAAFYSNAEAALEAQLETSGASNAALGADVLVMLRGLAHVQY